MSSIKIHPIVMGTKIFDKTMMTHQYGSGQQYTIPIYSWYLEGADARILVDTGEMSPIQSDSRAAAIGGKIYTFEQGLARYDLKPEDIDIVIHTHLHNDHCENDYKCTNAKIYVHAKELENIHNPHPLDFRYLEDFILDVEESGQLQILTNDADIVPGIRVIHTPRPYQRRDVSGRGYCRGHCSDHRILCHRPELFPATGNPGHGDGGHSSWHPCQRLRSLRHTGKRQADGRHPHSPA